MNQDILVLNYNLEPGSNPLINYQSSKNFLFNSISSTHKPSTSPTTHRVLYWDDKRQEFFIDRHRPTFQAILYFYQSGGEFFEKILILIFNQVLVSRAIKVIKLGSIKRF